MEWIEGVKLTDVEGMAAAGHELTSFVNVGVESTLRQLLDAQGGFFHADPHPGAQPFEKHSACWLQKVSMSRKFRLVELTVTIVLLPYRA